MSAAKRQEAGSAEIAAPEISATAGIEEAVANLIRTVRVASAEEMRAYEFKATIAPKLRAAGYQAEHIRDITDWGCEPQRKTFEDCRRLLAKRGAIVALVGIRGSGKTMIAAQLAAEWLREDYASAQDPSRPTTCRTAPYRKLTDLLAIYKPLYADFGCTDPERLAGSRDFFCTHNELIVIDEVGECDELKTRERLLTDFIDRIYAAGGRAMLISNQTREGFAESAGSSIMSRLTQYGAIMVCNWRSWRERK
jgi:DNA replication protein DnaC